MKTETSVPAVETVVPATTNPISIVTEAKPAIVTADAWTRYNQPNTLAGLPMRRVLPLNIIFKIVEVLRRFRGPEYSLTWEDLTWLVQFDGEKTVKCAICGREFRPLKWVHVTERFLRTLGEVKGDLSKAVLKGGAYLVVGEDINPLCGPLYYYGPNKKAGGEFMITNPKSCLGLAYAHKDNTDADGHQFMPHSLEEATRIRDERIDVAREAKWREQEKARLAREQGRLANLGALFDKAKALKKTAGQKS